LKQNVGFSTSEISLATGLSARRMRYAVEAGLATPSVLFKAGTGNGWRWSLADAFALAVIATLRGLGCSFQSLRLIQRYLGSRPGREFRDLSRRFVFAPGSRRYKYGIALIDADEYESLLRMPGQRMQPFVVDAGKLFAEVRARLDKIRAERKPEPWKKRDRRAEVKRETDVQRRRSERAA